MHILPAFILCSMAKKNNKIVKTVLSMLEETSKASPNGAVKLCQGWVKYALTYLRLTEWPQSIVKACLRRGPTKPMSGRNIAALLSFFIGNGLPYICSGHWVLIRIGVRKCENKDRKAKRAIYRILRNLYIAKTKANDISYFDLEKREQGKLALSRHIN